MSDYQTALQAWVSGGNSPGAGGAMPEAFRIVPVLKKSAEHHAAVDRVREWTRERFKLGEVAAIMVAEVSCSVPGCPPLETVVAFWTETDKRHQFKIFKRVEAVVAGDLPPSFMKNALMQTDDTECDCC